MPVATTERPLDRLIASMADVPEGDSAILRYRQALTTMPSPASLYMQKLMRSFGLDTNSVEVLRFTSPTSPASNALTSSQPQRSERSLSYSVTGNAMDELKKVLIAKNRDYAGELGEFWNFEFAAKVANVEVEDVMLALIGIKLGRIKSLRESTAGEEMNEPLRDSYRDLAGYANILNAYADS